jgi:hypothetical protein
MGNMKRESATPSIPLHDYNLALKSAVSWLGDRYLLAEPLAKRRDERREYFVAARSWIGGKKPRTSISAPSS